MEKNSFRPQARRTLGVLKVAICLHSKSRSGTVCRYLSALNSKSFSFSCEVESETDIVVADDQELLFKAMDRGMKPIQVGQRLADKEIVSRLISRFNLA